MTAAEVVAKLVERWDTEWHLKISHNDVSAFIRELGVSYDHSRRMWIDADGNEAAYIDVPQPERTWRT